jgi:CDGSH-type Zn-finger protein
VTPDDPSVELTVYENGPLIVRGDFVLQDSRQNTIDPGRKTVALCRCGLSVMKPFCDGNHALRATRRTS